MLGGSVSGAGVQRMEMRMDTKQSTSNSKLFIFRDNKQQFRADTRAGWMEMKAAKFVSAFFSPKKKWDLKVLNPLLNEVQFDPT